VTHDQEEALSLADVLAVLRDGQIVQQGTPGELYHEPVDAPLARFLGAANLLSATIEGGVAHTALGALQLRPGTEPVSQTMERVLLRPEQLSVQPQSNSVTKDQVEGETRLVGLVERCDYYGHDAILTIRPAEPCGTELLLARVQGDDALPADTPVLVGARGLATPIA
jgi:iron(III) transport system ATP-binding protein